MKRASLTRLVPDLLFDCSRVLEYAKIRTVLQSKAIPLFLSHFKIPSVGPVSGIEPATSRSVVKRSTDGANPAAVKMRL